MLEKEQFLQKYSLTDAQLFAAGISWQILEKIYNHYCGIRESLLPTAKYIADALREESHVQYVKFRLKDPEHLIEKIIRKKRKHPGWQIDEKNYQEIITDLIGVRAIHLFKRDWLHIHHFVMSNWQQYADPKAYVGCASDEKVVKEYQRQNCVVRTHPFGYQSIHYLIIAKQNGSQRVAELQVRTLLEEAWSEIDHQIRYPYHDDDPIIAEHLKIFNGMIEQLDQMGGIIRALKNGGADKNKTVNNNHESKEVEQGL